MEGMSRDEGVSFLRRVFLAMLALVLVIALVLSGTLLIAYGHSADALVKRFFDDLLLQSNYSITYTNELAQKLVASLSYNRDVIAFLNLQTLDNLQTVVTNKAVNTMTLPLSYVDGVYLYNKALDIVLSTKNGIQSPLDGFYDAAITRTLREDIEAYDYAPTPIVHEVELNRQKAFVYSYIVPEYGFTGDVTAAIVVNIKVDALTTALRDINVSNEDIQFVLTDADGAFLSQSPFDDVDETRGLHDAIRGIVRAGGAGNATLTIGGTRYLASYNNRNSNGWYLFGMIPRSVMYRDVTASTAWALLLIAGVTGACAVIAFALARRLNRPVQAMTRVVRGETLTRAESDAIQAREFRYMAAVIASMQEQNEAFEAYKARTAGFVRQEFLLGLIDGTAAEPAQRAAEQLEALGCGFLARGPACMCVLGIDDYRAFAAANNRRERWAMRGAVAKLVAERLSETFACEVVGKGADRFVALIDCRSHPESARMSAALERALADVIAAVRDRWGLSLSAAHGASFVGIANMPTIYENLEELLLLRVRYGHGRVLSPGMAEDVAEGDLRISGAAESGFASGVGGGNEARAMAQFEVIAADLFRYGYHEMMPYLVHLAYLAFDTAREACPAAAADVGAAFRAIVARLPQCEVEDDFRQGFGRYVRDLCAVVARERAAAGQRSSNALVQRVLAIVDASYARSELCLVSIADEMGLSAHYLGQIFRKAQGKSVARHLLELRIERMAQALREGDRSFAEILVDVGFEPEQKNYVYTCFKRHMGVTAKAYRMGARGEKGPMSDGADEDESFPIS